MDGQAKGMRIVVSKDGPYLVYGGVPLSRAEIVTNEEGESVAYRVTEMFPPREKCSLCRCGASESKPFCDGSHNDIPWDGAETAGQDSFLERSVCIDGPGLKLRDVRELCAEARFCDRAGGLWNLIERCDDPEIRALVDEEAALCPSGRYATCESDDAETMREPHFEPSIVFLEDPQLGVSGPMWVRGGIPVISAEGVQYEVRNRVTLCRCGQSANKPFCDGTHIKAEFKDGVE